MTATQINPATEVPDKYKEVKVKGQQVTIFDRYVEVNMPNGQTKAISLEDFQGALGKCLDSEAEIKSMLLPANCYLWAQSASKLEVACYYPGKVRDIQFVGSLPVSSRHYTKGASKYFKIPFPNIVICHRLNRLPEGSWRVNQTHYYATSKSPGQLPSNFITGQDSVNQIWLLPFSNIHADGQMCEGNNKIPKEFKDNFRGLDWNFAVLFNSPFNDDLGVKSTATGNWTCGGWYSELTKYETFPYELLKHGIKVTTVSKSLQSDILESNDQTTNGTIATAAPVQPEPTAVRAADLVAEEHTLGQVWAAQAVAVGRADAGQI